MKVLAVDAPAPTGVPGMGHHPAASRPATSSAERLAFIDSLRGLAAIYVLLFHQEFIPQPFLAAPDWAWPILFHGNSGVTLFFVVSAFSLCHAHSEGFSSPCSRRIFFIRRAARILPLFYVMLLVTLVRNWGFVHWPMSLGQVARAALLIFNMVPGDEGGIVPGAWTIGAEVVFYAVFPVIFGRVRSLPGIAAAIFASLLAVVVFHRIVFSMGYAQPALTSFFRCNFLRHLPVFLLGMGVWTLWDRFIRHRRRPRAQGAVLILGSLWAYHAYIHDRLTSPFPDPYYWEAIIFGALLLGLSILPAPMLVNRVTLFCGRISYSIYLLQSTIMFNLSWFYQPVSHWQCSASVRYLASLAMTLVCVMPLAALSYKYVERPGMRLGSRLIARYPA